MKDVGRGGILNRTISLGEGGVVTNTDRLTQTV